MLFSIIFISSCYKEPESFSSRQGASKIVSIELAEKIAHRVSSQFLQSSLSLGQRIAPDVIPDRVIQNKVVIPDKFNIPVLYVFNYVNREGFVVLSADERYEPICAIIDKGSFEESAVPSMFVAWFEATIENIEMVRYENFDNTERARLSWFDLFIKTQLVDYIQEMNPKPFDGKPIRHAGDDCCPECPNYPDCLYDLSLGCGAEHICQPNPDPCNNYNNHIVGPLLNTRWGQGCTYNEQCPDKDCQNPCRSNENAWTGCVATAMSQVLRYWEHPNRFNYSYSNMPSDYGNAEVQRMMRDVGDEIEMQYGCDASGAYTSEAAKELKENFNYSNADYDRFNLSWLQSDLDNKKPAVLDGCRTRTNRFLGLIYTPSNCHAWVCDGYWKTWNICYSQTQLHMNWGWDGSFDGWYLFDNWKPGSRNYQYWQHFIHNINP